MSTEIIEKLKTIIQPYLDEDEVTADDITLESNLIEDLGLDSFYVIDLVIEIENEFDIAIDNEEIVKLATVESVITMIQEKVAGKEE